jgi:uncharacterized peroxidase-related enzyme
MNRDRHLNESEVGDALALYDRVMQGPMRDKIPPVMSSTQSLRPDIFSAVMAAGKPILFEGELPVSVKQMIVMVIANQRKCRFCAEAHRIMLENMGIDKAIIESCIEDPEMKRVPPMYRQILRFALHAAEDPNHVDDGQFERLRDSGLNEEEILETSMVASFANFLVTWTDVPADPSD